MSIGAQPANAAIVNPATVSPTGSKAGISVPGHLVLDVAPGERELHLDRVVATGATWVRIDLPWMEVEPSAGQFDWSNTDATVQAAKSRGLNVVGVLTDVPQWARPVGSPWNHAPTTSAQVAGFASYARAMAARYAGQVDVWEVWNEPNLTAFWAPKPAPAQYAALLRAAYPAIKAGNSKATVLSAGTGGASPEHGDIESVDFIKAMYSLGLQPYFDALAVHPYSDPTKAMSGEMWVAFEVRKMMDGQGDAAKQIWATEAGVATGGDWSTDEATHARMITETFAQWATMRNAGPMFWYTTTDFAGDRDDRENHFGLWRTDGTPKPAVTSLQSLTIARTTPAPPKVRRTVVARTPARATADRWVITMFQNARYRYSG